MLPRFHLMSATLLALAATMSEEDAPVVPSPDDLDAPPDLWSTPLGRAMVDDMRADEDAVAGAAVEAKVVAAFPHMQTWEAQDSLNSMIGGPSRGGRNMYREYIERKAKAHILRRSWGRDRSEQRADKKARAKRKAKKGWA